MRSRSRPLSLHPLSMDKAATDILKVKSEPKPLKKKPKKSRPINDVRVSYKDW
jgi:hypothetical protein